MRAVLRRQPSRYCSEDCMLSNSLQGGRRRAGLRVLFRLAFLSSISTAAFSEEMQHDHAQMDHSQMDHAKHDDSGRHSSMSAHSSKAAKPKKKRDFAPSHAGHDMATHGMAMKGFLGPYPLAREGSGTSWVPD